MKKATLLALFFLLLFSSAFAQNVPQGMKYQAVARDLAGNILANQQITLKISLVNADKSPVVFYSEVHTATTSPLGLFTLVIGEGQAEKGRFEAVPWSTDEIWMQVSIKDKDGSAFATISNSKLLAVPYAFHAGTASQLVNQKSSVKEAATVTTTAAASTATPANVWILGGNLKSNPLTDKLGTADNVGLNIITNKTDRISIAANGDVDIKQNVKLNTLGGTTDIKGATSLQNTLTVTGATQLNNKVDVTGITSIKNNTASTGSNNGALVVTGGAGIGGDLNVGGKVNFGGASSFGGQLHITDQTQSTSTITGALIMDGGSGIAKNLNVGGTTDLKGAVNLQNTLDVTGTTHLKSTLTTDGTQSITNTTASTDAASGALVVKGGVGIGADLNVSNNIAAKGLNIVNDNATYLATFQNTNTSEGDGIKIKLGRAKTLYTALALPTLSETEAQQFKDLIRCDYVGSKLTLLGNIVASDLEETGKVIAGVAVGAGNMIINVLNDKLSLPIVLPALDVPAIQFPKLAVPDIVIHTPDPLPNITLPGFTVTDAFQLTPKIHLIDATTVMPKLPQIDLTSIGIPSIDITSLDFWGIPNLGFCLSDAAGTTPLNNNNEFIRFADKDDNLVGSIKAQSVSDWANNFLSPIFLFKLRGALLSSKMDKFHAQFHFKSELTSALLSYRKIGVEYTSGNGDYAEWLERMDKAEAISAGDIVGVIGGKITKNLEHAEQVLVVSHNPIILGNTPAEGKAVQGNNIAFMGQVPVKVLGPVSSGDYIVGQVTTPGYGIAKHPAQMGVDDFKNAVGRSWVGDESEGPKMVNTVVGVHNNNFLNIIKGIKEKEETTEARLKIIEARLKITAPANRSVSPKMASKSNRSRAVGTSK